MSDGRRRRRAREAVGIRAADPRLLHQHHLGPRHRPGREPAHALLAGRRGDQPALHQRDQARAGSCTPSSRGSTGSSSPPTVTSAPTCPTARQAGVAHRGRGARRCCSEQGHRSAAGEDGGDLLGLRGAVHEPGAQFSASRSPGCGRRERSEHGLRRAGRRQRASGAWSRRSSSATWATRSCWSRRSQRRRTDDPAQQGLPHPRLRQLHLDAQDGRDGPPPQRHRADLQPGGGHPAQRRRHASTRP